MILGCSIPEKESGKVRVADPGEPATLPVLPNHLLPNRGVVLVAIDAPGLLVLLLVDQALVGGGKVAVILCAHAPLFVVDAGFLMLDVRGFAGG